MGGMDGLDIMGWMVWGGLMGWMNGWVDAMQKDKPNMGIDEECMADTGG